jgi:hypothetical protein
MSSFVIDLEEEDELEKQDEQLIAANEVYPISYCLPRHVDLLR